MLLTCTHHFLKPAFHPGTIIVELYAGVVGRTSLTLEHKLYIKGQPDVIGYGDVKMVWITVDNQRPIPVPNSVRLAMGAEPLDEAGS